MKSVEPQLDGPETLLFLPGASGNRTHWRAVSDGLAHSGPRRFLGWPGCDGLPLDPSVNGIPDLAERVVESIQGPVVLFAQSMGGVIAVRAALARPQHVRGLILAATSGGVDVGALGGTDWRPAFRASNPNTPPWFVDDHEDLSPRFADVRAPVLLLWGDADPISPVAVGERLARLFVSAELVVVKGGTHDLVSERSGEILPYIVRFMKNAQRPRQSR